MSILIMSLPGDFHALGVKYALERKRQPVSLMCWSDFPQRHKVSFVIDSVGLPQFVFDSEPLDPIDPGKISAFWNHRRAPATPHPQVSHHDHAAIALSADLLLAGLVTRLEEISFAVNPAEAKRRFDNKLTQLSVATDCGFRIPRTLVSNDYGRVRAFVEGGGACVIKPLKYMKWKCGSADADLKTTRLTSVRDINPLSIEACPMIYQEEIGKKFEYRVVVFGHEVVAFRIESQQHRGSSLDWRAIDYRKLSVVPESLDRQTCERIIRFMNACGFVTGSFDFAIDQNDELVFFEFNESGQFLWLEELCPEVPLLDMISEFLIAANPGFRYTQGGNTVRFDQFIADSRYHQTAASRRHVTANLDKRFKES